VHFNLHSDKPLEVLSPKDDDDRAFDLLVDSALSGAPALPRAAQGSPSDESIAELCTIVESDPMGLITCGFDPEEPRLDPLALARFARATGYPVLLDASHPLRLACPSELLPYVVAPYEPLLRLEGWQTNQSPRVVVQLGRPLTSTRWERYLNQLTEGRLLVIARRGWPDPTGRGTLVTQACPTEVLTLAAECLESNCPRSSGWQARWLRAAEATGYAIKKVLGAELSQAVLGELTAVFVLLRALPESSRLVIGNSLPVRHLDFIAGVDPHSGTGGSVVVEALRGVSGIDGVTSTAIGFALGDDQPTTLLLGDLSFMHDVGGLASAQQAIAPLAIVVLNNGGGRIFEQLPIGQSVNEEELSHFTTPHQLDLSHASALYGLPHLRVTSAHGITDALHEAHSHPGATIIEIVVAKSSYQTQPVQCVAAVKAELLRLGLLSPDTSTEPSRNDP
jgi:2-succinyl-5-enolpyruvyl-6-hydroxy-3-cyclohexene-1-carboxylate synthase